MVIDLEKPSCSASHDMLRGISLVACAEGLCGMGSSVTGRTRLIALLVRLDPNVGLANQGSHPGKRLLRPATGNKIQKSAKLSSTLA
jgi:hypothetical protein